MKRVALMHSLWRTTTSEFARFVRQPANVFFGFVVPLLVLLATGTILGNEPSHGLGGYGATDRSIPGQLGVIVAAVGLIMTPQLLASYRRGRLVEARRTVATLSVLRLGQILVNLTVAVLGAVLVLTAGWLLYELRLPTDPLALALAFTLSCGAFIALGIVLGALLPTVPAARVVGIALFVCNLLLSGTAIPPEALSPLLQRLGFALPLTHVRELFDGLWLGRGWDLDSLLVLAAILATAGVSALIRLRSEGRRGFPTAGAA